MMVASLALPGSSRPRLRHHPIASASCPPVRGVTARVVVAPACRALQRCWVPRRGAAAAGVSRAGLRRPATPPAGHAAGAGLRGRGDRAQGPAAAGVARAGGEAVEGGPVGVVIVDHGSRRAASNDLLEDFVAVYVQATGREIVEPAHMELAEPSIADAFARCVERGATTVAVVPYFLSPGRHWKEDIPSLAAEAAAGHPGVRHIVSAPIGVHALVAQVLDERLEHCLGQAEGDGSGCAVCADDPGRCAFKA